MSICSYVADTYSLSCSLRQIAFRVNCHLTAVSMRIKNCEIPIWYYYFRPVIGYWHNKNDFLVASKCMSEKKYVCKNVIFFFLKNSCLKFFQTDRYFTNYTWNVCMDTCSWSRAVSITVVWFHLEIRLVHKLWWNSKM